MKYVRNAWYVAAWVKEIAPDRPAGIRILNQPIVLWRNSAGELVAFEDRCIHRLAPLSLGRCEGETLRCMYHGMLYDRTGRVVEIPGQERVAHSLRVRKYPVAERYGWIWIWMGDATADESLVPPLIGMEASDYVIGHGHLDYAADARLINDNLLDLSHVSFLHTNSFGMSESWARERPVVTEQERGVRSERWFRNEGPLGTVNTDKRVDSYFRYDFFVPGALVMTTRTYPVGTANGLNGQSPDLSQPPESFTSQAVTPLTDKTARYFYIMGARRLADETVYDMTITDRAFAEDKTMIEAQQRNLDATPGWRFIATTADRGAVTFNLLVEKLAREEESAHSLA